MIKLVVAIKRLPEMSAEEFQAHWRTNHASLVKNNPATLKYVRKYVQCHTMLTEYEQGEVAFDGTAELWFDTVQDKDAFFSDPDYLSSIHPDESQFADMTRTVFFMTVEEPILDNT